MASWKVTATTIPYTVTAPDLPTAQLRAANHLREHTQLTLVKVMPSPPPPATTPGELWAPDAYMNTMKTGASLDPSSATVAGKLVQAGQTAWVSMDSGSCSFYRVPDSQPRVKVIHTVPGGTGRNLQPALDYGGGVPVPPDATSDVIRNGNDLKRDGHVVIVQGDDYWELYQLRNDTGVWKASTGGCIQGVSSHAGVYRDGLDWPTGSFHTWGDTGSSIPVMSGTITVGEWQAAQADEKAGKGGLIPHELALDLPAGYVRGSWHWPAQRTDGSANDNSLPMEGDCFRLDPAFDLSTLKITAQRIMARTLQTYGCRLRDRSQVLGLYMEDPYTLGHDGQWVINTLFEGHWPGTNPGGWLQTNGGFPWDRMQLLKRTTINNNDAVPTNP